MRKILVVLMVLLGFAGNGCVMHYNKNFFNEIRDNAPPVPTYTVYTYYQTVYMEIPPTTYRQAPPEYRIYGRGYHP